MKDIHDQNELSRNASPAERDKPLPTTTRPQNAATSLTEKHESFSSANHPSLEGGSEVSATQQKTPPNIQGGQAKEAISLSTAGFGQGVPPERADPNSVLGATPPSDVFPATSAEGSKEEEEPPEDIHAGGNVGGTREVQTISLGLSASTVNTSEQAATTRKLSDLSHEQFVAAYDAYVHENGKPPVIHVRGSVEFAVPGKKPGTWRKQREVDLSDWHEVREWKRDEGVMLIWYQLTGGIYRHNPHLVQQWIRPTWYFHEWVVVRFSPSLEEANARWRQHEERERAEGRLW